jgi:hypothetical protein
MKYKITSLLLLMFLSASSFISLHQSEKEIPPRRWIISKNSSLSVNGSTNINKFSCIIPAYGRVDTLTLSENKTNSEVKLSGEIDLNISSFDCHNSGMTKQLRKTLDGIQYPVMRIRFLSLNNIPVLTMKPNTITGFVQIELAGISKQFEVHYQIVQDDQKTIHLLGSREVLFSNFNLVPPQKLGGMIKTKNQLSVDFQLNMRPMD